MIKIVLLIFFIGLLGYVFLYSILALCDEYCKPIKKEDFTYDNQFRSKSNMEK
jgi:hypothetical protein